MQDTVGGEGEMCIGDKCVCMCVGERGERQREPEGRCVCMCVGRKVEHQREPDSMCVCMCVVVACVSVCMCVLEKNRQDNRLQGGV